MFEQWSQSVPANTTEAAPVTVELRISPGILRAVHIYFPAGCQLLAKTRVFLGEKPVMPRSPKGHVKGEDSTVPAIYLFERTKGNRPVLKWVLWNEDDTYAHQLTLSAEWTSEEEAAVEIGLLRKIEAHLKTFVSRTVAPEEA